MIKKIGSFFEEHIEKIVIVIVGVLCVLLFIWRILFSPNTVEYMNNESKTEKLSPGALDNYVYQEALLLSQRQSTSPTAPNSYIPRTDEFLAVLDSAIGNVDTRRILPNPEIITPTVVTRGEYNLPQIGGITDVAVEHIRAAAYVPLEPITEQKTYDQVEHEPNDIDLITVEGKFDIAGLYNRFHESFVDQVEELRADPCLAKPIFASVNLQRRELMNDGTWSNWQNVQRPKTDHNKKLLEPIQEGKKLPPGGSKVRMLQFDNKQMQIDLLQPQAYQFASAREEWFPPQLHRDYIKAMEKEMREERREAKEAEKQERTRETSERRGGRGSGGFYDGGTGMDGTGGRGTRRGSRGRGTNRGGDTSFSTRGRGGRQDPFMEMERFMPGGTMAGEISPINEVYREFNKIRLDWTTDLSKMREPLVFWAHDDTIETEKSYQYRIRIGVFNPVAEGEKDDVVLWSEFSDVTDPVDIPGKLYFFVKSIQETANTVTITICKYFLGYWRSEDFRGIGPGEAIGGIVEYEPEEPEEQPFTAGRDGRFAIPTTTRPEEQTVEPESINFDTGAVMVDVIAVNEWVASDDRNLSIKPYYDMLYSFDGTNIEHTPVRSSNWPEQMRRVFATVQRLSRETKEPFKAFSSSGARRGTGTDPYQMGEYDDMYQERMMMDQMGGRY